MDLTRSEAELALHLSGATPSPASPLSQLGAPASVESAVLQSLRNKQLVDSRGALTPAANAAFATLATPTHRAGLHFESTEQWYDVEFYAGRGGLVGCAGNEHGCRLTIPATVDQPIESMSEWLQWDTASSPPSARVDVDAGELCAIAAIVDASREERLRATLERRLADLSRFSHDQLAYQVQMAEHNDPRWLATLLRRHAPPPFRPDIEQLNAGVHELVTRGWLLRLDGDAAVLGEPLMTLTTQLANVTPHVTLEVAGVGIVSQSVLVMRGVDSCWAVRFPDPELQRVVRVEALGGADLEGLMRRYLRELPDALVQNQAAGGVAMRDCAGCGERLAGDVRFCSTCGRPVSQ